MLRDAPLLDEHIYHIYNRGAHKADIFLTNIDYARFQLLLFLSNSIHPIHTANLLRQYKNKGLSFINVYSGEDREQLLVDVLAYALMPNHFHLILRQRVENGISIFMRKLGTAYSSYFNAIHEHSGTVFQGTFKSTFVDVSEYLRWLFAYVALNPLDVGFPSWKERGVSDPQTAYDFLKNYPHASFPDMCGEAKRPESAILSFSALEEFGEDVPDFSDIKELFEVENIKPEF